MCGISGIVRTGSTEAAQLRAAAEKMAQALAHRGPDDVGVWVDADSGAALAHRRLSILDLSAEGHQPMLSVDARQVICFNGEIYNFQEIRLALEKEGRAPAWRGHSDTEVVLAAISAWGLDATLSRMVGMFAFALWDRANRSLHLVRDRMGEKPLYYGWVGDAFLFASELKALRAYPGFDASFDRDAIAAYVRLGYVPAPQSVYKGIWKLPPATRLTLASKDLATGAIPAPLAYWSLDDVVRSGRRARLKVSASEAAAALDSLLGCAVADQMVADVPLGAFLSGGIDSSTVVALMQSRSAKPIRTFSIGFLEAGYNEAEQARRVAQHLGTQHTDLYVTPEEALAVVPRLPVIFDEPFADASQIPTYLLARLARAHVTVSLSGDGGDEVFGGYNRYAWSSVVDTWVGGMPVTLRRAAAAGLAAVPPSSWNRLFNAASGFLPGRFRQRLPGDKLHKLAAALPYRSTADLYRRLISHWYEEDIVLGARHVAYPQRDVDGLADLAVAEEMMAADAVGYLPDDILVKVDRAAMAVGLETRVPLLDHRVVEFAWRLPLDMKIRGTRGKDVLRKVLAKYVPPSLTERAKMGFSVPLDAWLRGPLREWAEDLLARPRLEREGFLAATPIRARWHQHLAGTHNWQQPLWTVLMFQAWLEAQRA